MANTSSLGLFGRLPPELRRKVYSYLFRDQLVHCCSAKGHSDRHGIARASSPISPCSIKAFEKECVECCKSDCEAPMGSESVPGWSHVVSYAHNIFSPSDWLSLLLTCRTFWEEVEPLQWDLITLSVGIPQFPAFYHRFLRNSRNLHLKGIARGQLLRGLQIILPNVQMAAPTVGHGWCFLDPTAYDFVMPGMYVAVSQLQSYAGLNDVSILIDASMTVQDARPEKLLLLHHSTLSLILCLQRPIDKFAISIVGQRRNPTGNIAGSNYDDLPDEDHWKRRLLALIAVLTQIIKGQIEFKSSLGTDSFDEEEPGIVELEVLVRNHLGIDPE